MAFSFFSSCWHYFQIEECVHEEELPCEEEEEGDEICWFLGKILLFYCLVVAFLMILYHTLEWMHENRNGGFLSSGCWIKLGKGQKDGSRKGSRTEGLGANCTCCCRLAGLCAVLRKLFGEKEKAQEKADSQASSVSLKRRLSKRLSRLSQQTFCDSDSSYSASAGSQAASWKVSKTEDSLSIASIKELSLSQVAKAPGSHWTRDQPCLRCKAKRTKEWLTQHFFGEGRPPQGS